MSDPSIAPSQLKLGAPALLNPPSQDNGFPNPPSQDNGFPNPPSQDNEFPSQDNEEFPSSCSQENEEFPNPPSQENEEEKPEPGLHFRSAPGAGLVLAGFLVVVGVGVATAGYWPPRAPPRQSPPRPRERLKLIGPIILAVGLFILICSSTLLYENRDRQRAQENGGKKKHKKKRRRRKTKPPSEYGECPEEVTVCLPSNLATHTLTDSELNIHCVTETPGTSEDRRQNCLDPSSPEPSHCNPSCGKSLPQLNPPIIKLNNCVIDPYPLEPPPLPQRTYKLKRSCSSIEGP
ncbi:hypothetical protein ACEWY4_019468 [Coilia grayii]|uniref:Uncharacterized protein n=1 Tax=Coilia grayii TaxID=363190 RepID=A0ABD1JBJ4_9TELE